MKILFLYYKEKPSLSMIEELFGDNEVFIQHYFSHLTGLGPFHYLVKYKLNWDKDISALDVLLYWDNVVLPRLRNNCEIITWS